RDGHVTGVQTCALPILKLWVQVCRLHRLPSISLLTDCLEIWCAKITSICYNGVASSVISGSSPSFLAFFRSRGQWLVGLTRRPKIGRASCRERVEISVA